MKYIVEKPLCEFHAWSSGLANLLELEFHPAAFDYIENYIDSLCEEDDRTETDINDILWFEMYDILEEAGFVNEEHEWID